MGTGRYRYYTVVCPNIAWFDLESPLLTTGFLNRTRKHWYRGTSHEEIEEHEDNQKNRLKIALRTLLFLRGLY